MQIQTINSIEDLTLIPYNEIRAYLNAFTPEELALASKGVSPAVNARLEAAFSEVDFSTERMAIGIVPIEAIEAIHSRMLEAVNEVLGSHEK